ncbi:MAG: polyprenyl synthetase family protein [Planctomycetes bacterium]|nr:polyprenyl synthetase family protein [Planctomycetota bacterium]
MQQADFDTELSQKAAMTEKTLRQILADQTEIPPRLKEAMEYMLFSPGKKIRSAMVLWCCELVSGQVSEAALLAAAAIEMVHTYSLIHDDLPAMDNDDFRRGRPSCHKQFDEATAILTGDALLTLAFEILTDGVENPKMGARMIRLLAQSAGPAGMIAGQMADFMAEHTQGTMDLLRHIHINKTARMFAAATGLGAIAGGAKEKELEELLQYGLKIGLCFQIADDILDETAISEQLGKTAGKDKQQGKLTYPSLVGLKEAQKVAAELTREAVDAIDRFGGEADILRQVAQKLLNRNK